MSLVNIAVGQSGGPTTVINASLYGVIKEACDNNDKIDKIYGMINGIEGFIEGKVIDIVGEVSEDEIELLKHTPAAYLGSCRYKLPESMEDSIYRIIFEKFDKLNIKYFIYIGGNDSMDTVHKLSVYAKMTNSPVRIIGVPKTIDNDLTKTDHSPGYGSAAKYVATTVRDIVMDANVYDTHSVTIIELMGRHAGWITAASVLARKYKGDNPVLIYLPEVAFDVKEFVQRVKSELNKKHNVIVCVSEGIKDSEGKFICEYSSEAGVDTFGHKMLTGCGKYLENVIKEELGVKVRSVELNVNQRCKAALASMTDIEEAIMAGRNGVKAGLNGETGKMIAMKREDTEEYSIVYETVDCSEVCNQEKVVPREWISEDGTDILQGFIDYVLPLIQGESLTPIENGLPKYCYRK
ncbi:MAG: 6-phosphofructokinase [Lachnospiraceae bacterium]|nr:6-phosphofructokinase [Clostridiales bacterium]MDD6292959.1 6-phosphofructokinase [Eubacteriales bacterium]MDY2607505.1 6-phosphofructokinase [Lachnospiraceae bacterium]